MIRALQQRFNGVIANAAAPSLSSASLSPLSTRAMSIAPVSSVMPRSFKATKPHPIGDIYLSRHAFHSSTIHQKSIDDVYVTNVESGSSNNTKTEQSTPDSTSNDDSSESSGGSCSQGVPNLLDEEEEQEEMFVTSDPVLGIGNVLEWGGPRRGGRQPEPTRFGDWERKGRCTDF